MKKIVFLFLLAFSCTVGLFAQSRAELEQRRGKILEEIQYTNRLLQSTQEQRKENLNQLNIVQRKINLRMNVIDNLQENILWLEERIGDNNLVIEMMNSDLEAMQKEYADLIREAYKRSKGFSPLLFILSARDFNQAYRRYKYVQQISDFRREQAEIIREMKEIIEEKTVALEDDLREIDQLQAREERQVKLMVQERSRKNNLITNLNRKERQLRNQLQEKERIAERIRKEIEELIEREKEKMKYATLTPEDKIISDAFQQNKGRLPWPVSRGIITAGFGRHRNAVFQDVMEDNMGIEITSETGEKARAIFKGTVVKVFGIPGANQIVIIRHGNYLTVYQNLVNVQVTPGEQVETKQVIGNIFEEEKWDGKCLLKFMIFHEREKQNPEDWLTN